MTGPALLVAEVAHALREYQRQPGVLNPEHGTLWIDHAEEPTRVMLDAVPDGWAKVNGEWVELVLHYEVPEP